MNENTPEKQAPSAPELRIVFEHTNGPLKGLRAIQGTASQLTNTGQSLPSHAKGFTAQGRSIDFASLVKVERRYALYREILRDSQGQFYPQRVR